MSDIIPSMFSTRPYLIRAFYEWIIDNNCTPYVVVNALMPEVQVPEEYVESGQIVFNIDNNAVKYLDISNEALSFEARFSGQLHQVYVPVEAVIAIYAKENGRGTVFAEEELDPPPANIMADTASVSPPSKKRSRKSRAHLKIVK